MPPVDVSAAADKAFELLDKDGSKSLDESELGGSPGLLAARDRYDTDRDRQISYDEMTARLNSVYSSRGTAWMTVTCQVIQGGRPLANAKVRFVPESYLAEALQPAEGTTNPQGEVFPAVAADKRPETFKGSDVMQPGVYRVEIEHANVKQPHKPLGCEVDALARNGAYVVFRL
jgi:hypothetical protein